MEEIKINDSANNMMLGAKNDIGIQSFGLMSNFAWYDDPRRMAFHFARYKFVSKMLSGKENVLEVGCADAFGTRVVVQEVKNLTAIDIEPAFIQDVNERMCDKWHFNTQVHDVLEAPIQGRFDGAYSLDVLEHISSEHEDEFIKNICLSLTEDGVLIIGMPSLESQQYASPTSKEGHINCKSGSDLKVFLEKYFNNVFLFSMNDEVVHTGYSKMAHYLIGVCCMKKL
ncbi:MAG: methyltransferase domain-containing protein [Legionellaceae bacterium]|nr:methyltransferase domain-containing protein [Legionellaceae bacterium]